MEASYAVNFIAGGLTSPAAGGLNISVKGFLIVNSRRPETSKDIPVDVIKRCKKAFVYHFNIIHYGDDSPGRETYPIVWLGAEMDSCFLEGDTPNPR